MDFMINEKGHYVMPNDIVFLSSKAFFKVMSNLDKKGLVIRNTESFGTYSGSSGIYFIGYSITQYAVEYLAHG